MIDGGADILRNKVCREAIGHSVKSLAKRKRCLLKSFVVTQIGNNSLLGISSGKALGVGEKPLLKLLNAAPLLGREKQHLRRAGKEL